MAKKIIRSSRDTRKPAKTSKSAKHSAPSEGARPALNKLDAMVAALRAPKGATVAQLSVLTGWLPHSVRGAMSGALKKKRGLTIVSAKTDGARVYRIGGKA